MVAVIIPPGPILIPPAAVKDVALNVPVDESNLRFDPALAVWNPVTISPPITCPLTNTGYIKLSVDSSVTNIVLADDAVPTIVDKPIKFPSNLSMVAVFDTVIVENVPTSASTLP